MTDKDKLPRSNYYSPLVDGTWTDKDGVRHRIKRSSMTIAIQNASQQRIDEILDRINKDGDKKR